MAPKLFGPGRPRIGNSAHRHDHRHDDSHGHSHGVIDPVLATTTRGIHAIKWSFVILAITAGMQMVVVAISGSVALFADTVHNVADAGTAIPLWIAFLLARRKPTARFTYGLGRVEDLAGLVVVVVILASAILAGYEAIDRLIHPRDVQALGWVAAAGIIGFVGNEAVALFRIRVGREINSAALVADGYHARTDGLTSLAVVLGAAGVWIGFPTADPIIGLAICAVILVIVWQSARAVISRMLDGVEPEILDEISHAAGHVDALRLRDVRARWIGHRLHAEIEIDVDSNLTVAEADGVAARLKKVLHEHMPALDRAIVAVVGQGTSPAS